MKIFSKLSQATAAIVLLSSVMLTSGIAFAGSPSGEIEGGNSNYTISNVTKGTGFTNTQPASACDILEYRLHLYNPGPGAISDVKVEATINTITPYTNYVSTATAYAPTSFTPQVSFESTLNISTAQTQSYVKDSTVLLNSAGNVINSSASGTLADTVTDGAGGIDIGSLGESVDEYLEFKALVNCPPAPVPAVCNSISTPEIDNNTVKIDKVNYTANDATVNDISLNFAPGVTNKYQTSQFPVSYTYPAAGQHTITATVETNLGNVTSPGCTISFTTTSPTNTVITPPPAQLLSTTTPTQSLINTGPGNIVGIFAATSIVGAIAHRIFKSRKSASRSL